MASRRFHKFIRKIHRYLGVIIGIQFLFWTVSGLYFSWTKINEIRGEHLVSEVEHKPDMSQCTYSIADIVADNELTGVEHAELVSVMGKTCCSIQTEEGIKLFDMASGVEVREMPKEKVKELAESRMANDAKVTAIEYVSSDNIKDHGQYRGKPLPAWAVEFDHKSKATFYFDAKTGAVNAVRTKSWRIFDWLWMTHIMDYKERDNINNYMLRAFSIFGLLTVLSGFTLFFVSSPVFRKY